MGFVLYLQCETLANGLSLSGFDSRMGLVCYRSVHPGGDEIYNLDCVFSLTNDISIKVAIFL